MVTLVDIAVFLLLIAVGLFIGTVALALYKDFVCKGKDDAGKHQ